MFTFSIEADLNWLVQGGQLCRAFPYSKVSLAPALKTYFQLTFSLDDLPIVGNLRLDGERRGQRLLGDDRRRRRRQYRLLGDRR